MPRVKSKYHKKYMFNVFKTRKIYINTVVHRYHHHTTKKSKTIEIKYEFMGQILIKKREIANLWS